MALGRRACEQQGELWIATQALPAGPGHVFYERLNGLLSEVDSTALWKNSSHRITRNAGVRGLLRAFTSGCCLWVILKGSTRSGGSHGDVRTACRCGHSWDWV